MSEYLIDFTNALLNGLATMLDTEFAIYIASVLIFVIVCKILFKFLLLR